MLITNLILYTSYSNLALYHSFMFGIIYGVFKNTELVAYQFSEGTMKYYTGSDFLAQGVLLDIENAVADTTYC